MNTSIGISQGIKRQLLLCAIQRILYTNKNNNIMWNSTPFMGLFPAKFVDNLAEK
jgi:hypothetical protein